MTTSLKKISRSIAIIAFIATLAGGCRKQAQTISHVIILGFDSMSARDVQRARTPNFNRMIENGAVSLHTRCVRETTSSQNWMSMVSAAPIEMHGVLNNSWEKDDAQNLIPALRNRIGLFPTIFDLIREQKPDYRQYAFIEWAGETRMYDTEVFDSCCVFRKDPDLHEKMDVMRKAISAYLSDRPEMMFVSMDITDHAGHTFGHESDRYLSTVSQMDSLTGILISELEKRDWMKNTVILITADHGGLGFGHGGDTMEEYEIPVIVFGGRTTKGKVMKRTNMIYDVGATAAGLLGVKLPWECRGKFLEEAFESADCDVYVPIPLVRPFSGSAKGTISIADDAEGAEIYYTLDGSDPDTNATRYAMPFSIEAPTCIKSIAFRKGCYSDVAVNYLSPVCTEPPVAYKLYKNISERQLPDFTKFGKPDAAGHVENFSLDELGLANEDHFAILFSSNLIVKEDATYAFEMKSDDGANLYIDGELVVCNASAHSREPAFGKISLSKGKHPMKVEFYEDTKVQDLTIRCSIDGEEFRPLMNSDLDR